MLKRQGAIQTYQGTPAKRIRVLENRVNKIYRRVDTKCSRYLVQNAGPLGAGTVTAQALTDITQHGDIKILYYKVSGVCQGNIDVYIVSTPTTTAPVAGNFAGVTGGSLTMASYESGFRIWSQGWYDAQMPIVRLQKRISKGFIVPQDDVGAREGKTLWLVIKNSTAASVPVNVTCEFFYVRAGK